MRIIGVDIEALRITLKKPFRVSLGMIDECHAMLIRVKTDDGLSGIGEGSPLGIITGETIEGTLSAARLFKNHLIGKDPGDLAGAHSLMDKLIWANPSAKAAYDIALHDLAAQRAGLPLYKYLGGQDGYLPIDITLAMGDIDTMAEEARRYVQEGFDRLKVKVGGNVSEDVARLKAIRAIVGKRVYLHLDANQGWTPEQAIQAMNLLEDCDIVSIEQPVPRWDVEGLAQVKKAIRVPVIADESVFFPHDAREVINRQAVDGIIIKLMKCGGLYRAGEISRIAHDRGVFCMMGCMMDTVVGIAAAAAFAVADQNIRIADLDSLFHIQDPGLRHGLRCQGGSLTLPEQPGLGVEW